MSKMEQDYDKESINLHDTDLRERYGKISSFVGIFVNVFLFAIKLFIGRLFRSVAVTAGAVKNLSDAGSSLFPS